MIAVAHALGKYPHEVARDMTEEQIAVFIGYLKLLRERGDS